MSQRAGGERDQLRSRSRVGSARKSTKMGEGVGVLEVGRHDSGKAVWFNLPAWLEVNDSCRNSQLFLSTRGERGFIGSRAVARHAVAALSPVPVVPRVVVAVA